MRLQPGREIGRLEVADEALADGADLFIDGFDFFVLDIRRKVFARCGELGIPALTAAPVGMGVGLLDLVVNRDEEVVRPHGPCTDRGTTDNQTALLKTLKSLKRVRADHEFMRT